MARCLQGCAGKKLITWMRWQHGAQENGSPAYCEKACGRRIGASTTRKCGECTEPPLWPENYDAAEWFNGCWPERLTDRAGVFVGFDSQKVHAVMQMLDLQGAEVFRKFRAVKTDLVESLPKKTG